MTSNLLIILSKVAMAMIRMKSDDVKTGSKHYALSHTKIRSA